MLKVKDVWGKVTWPMRKIETILPGPYRAIVLVALTWLALQLGIQELGGRVVVLVFAVVVAISGASVIKYLRLRLRTTRHRHHERLNTTKPPFQTPEARAPMPSPPKASPLRDSTLDSEDVFLS